LDVAATALTDLLLACSTCSAGLVCMLVASCGSAFCLSAERKWRNRGSGLDVAATALTDLLLVPLVPLVFGLYAGCFVRFGFLQDVSGVIVAADWMWLRPR
jgi:hypothetical protein